MTTYLTKILAPETPQSEPLLGTDQVPNSAGGYVWPVDDAVRLMRFLVLGSEGGSYYAGEQKLTRENADATLRYIKEDGLQAVETIARVSLLRRAPRNSPALFALAMAASFGDDGTRRSALDKLPVVARTGSHLEEWVGYVDGMRGWGRGLRTAITRWYTERPIDSAVYQMVKYRDRYSWTHRDLLRKAHPKTGSPALNQLFHWAAQGEVEEGHDELRLVYAFERAKTAEVADLVQIIREEKLPWEAVPSEALKHKEVWAALSEDMPINALVRNLATLTRVEVIAPMNTGWVTDRLAQVGTSKAQVHPINVLSALLTYKAGKGQRSRNTWNPVPQVTDALDQAFERSFDQAPRTNKRLYLGIDVSGSMRSGEVAGVPGLSPFMAATAMAMVVARREPNYYMAAFSDGRDKAGAHETRMGASAMEQVHLSANESITDAMENLRSIRMGGTDCALPMLDALQRKIPVDCFIVLTDSETWAGKVHPTEALRQYRKEMGIPAQLVVVAMVSNGFTIADPRDGGMMDVVGFDSAAPQLIAEFISPSDNTVSEEEGE